jgi:hypothetical protein
VALLFFFVPSSRRRSFVGSPPAAEPDAAPELSLGFFASGWGIFSPALLILKSALTSAAGMAATILS